MRVHVGYRGSTCKRQYFRFVYTYTYTDSYRLLSGAGGHRTDGANFLLVRGVMDLQSCGGVWHTQIGKHKLGWLL